jgi:hypothetical protein
MAFLQQAAGAAQLFLMGYLTAYIAFNSPQPPH